MSHWNIPRYDSVRVTSQSKKTTFPISPFTSCPEVPHWFCLCIIDVKFHRVPLKQNCGLSNTRHRMRRSRRILTDSAQDKVFFFCCCDDEDFLNVSYFFHTSDPSSILSKIIRNSFISEDSNIRIDLGFIMLEENVCSVKFNNHLNSSGYFWDLCWTIIDGEEIQGNVFTPAVVEFT